MKVVPRPGSLVDLDRAPVPADDAEHRRQAQPAAGELGGEEGVEDPRPGLGVHAAAGVRDLEADVAPGREASSARAARPRSRSQRRTRRRWTEISPARVADRLGGVDDQVHHHLPDLGRRRPRPAAGRRRGRGAGRRASARPSLERWAMSSTTSSRGRPARPANLPAAGVGQHLAAELRRAAGRGLTISVSRAAAADAGRQLGEGEVGVAQDRHQQVVEVVGDAAGEHAQALELLGLRSRALEAQPLLLGRLRSVMSSTTPSRPVARPSR